MVPASSEASSWHQLNLNSSRDAARVPQLHIKFTTYKSGSTRLTLHLTDLVTLYTCSLTKAEIIEEAERNNSPIQASSSDKQFDVLLNYLAQGLSGKQNTLTNSHSNDNDNNVLLKLRTTQPLPGSLGSLTFTFPLTQQPASNFSAELLRPVLAELQHKQTYAAKLLQVIKDKDHVIERLMEKVGSQVQGDMSVVFPMLTGKRERGVREAEKWVTGLKRFDALDETNDEREGVDGLLSVEGQDGSRIADANTDWVKRLPGEATLEGDAKSDTSDSTNSPSPVTKSKSISSPKSKPKPHSKAHTSSPPSAAPSPSSASSSPSPSPPAKRQAAQPGKTKRRLGALPKRKPPTPEKSPSPSPPPPEAPATPRNTSRSNGKSSTASTPATGHRLGKLGLRRKEHGLGSEGGSEKGVSATPEKASTARRRRGEENGDGEADADADTETESENEDKMDLDNVSKSPTKNAQSEKGGGKAAQKQKADHEERDGQEEEVKEEETPEQAAARRREELKRTTAAAAAAGGARKKRRF